MQLAGQPVRWFVHPQYNFINNAGADRLKFGFGFAMLSPAGGGKL